jgi:c-di-GMP-binding flagellar brake protein YcgR
MVREETLRDANAELIITIDGADGKPLRKSYKSRLFHIEPDGAMIAERPDHAVLDAVLAVGDAVEVLIVRSGQRFMGQSKVADVVSRQINEQLRVTCFRLAPAERIRIDQRRAFFRARSATSDHPEITVHAADPGRAWSIDGLMVNVGGGGVGVVVRADRKTLRDLEQFQHFTCEFFVGSDEKPATIAARLAHVATMEHGRIYLGLEFILPADKEGKAEQDRMVQFAAWLQRQSLKKRRA